MKFLECDGDTSLICMFTRYPGRFSGMFSEGWSSQWRLSPVNPLPCAVYCTIAAGIMVYPTNSPGDRSLPQPWPSARHARGSGRGRHWIWPSVCKALQTPPPQAPGPAVSYSRHRVGRGGDGGGWVEVGMGVGGWRWGWGWVGGGWEISALWLLSLAEEKESALNREICQNAVSNLMLQWFDILCLHQQFWKLPLIFHTVISANDSFHVLWH